MGIATMSGDDADKAARRGGRSGEGERHRRYDICECHLGDAEGPREKVREKAHGMV